MRARARVAAPLESSSLCPAGTTLIQSSTSSPGYLRHTAGTKLTRVETIPSTQHPVVFFLVSNEGANYHPG